MTHEIDIQGDVPLYGQQQCNWCGAASAQMIMNGYPDPTDRIFLTQLNIWNSIQANNSTNAIDVNQNWATDPQGLQGCLMVLNPPPGGTWNIHMDTIRDNLMFDIFFWMNRNNYPVAVLINEGEHWVVIVQYETDVEPIAGSTPTLNEITFYDPEPHNIGSVINKLAANWYANEWANSIRFPGTWRNNWVAVIEPPIEKGRVKVKMVERMGKKIIPPEKAIEYAKMWIEKRRLDKKIPYKILQRKDIITLNPILVREQSKGEKVTDFYIVPFGLEREIDRTRISIIVNAYTGEFEEIGSFGKPIKYLPEKEAIYIIAKAMGLTRTEIRDVEARMIFQPSKQTHIRIYPFWEIKLKAMEHKRILYVDQNGIVHKQIEPSVPGD